MGRTAGAKETWQTRLPKPQGDVAKRADAGLSQKRRLLSKNGVERELEIKVITGVCWYATAGSQGRCR